MLTKKRVEEITEKMKKYAIPTPPGTQFLFTKIDGKNYFGVLYPQEKKWKTKP
jgi:hypothetical protein